MKNSIFNELKRKASQGESKYTYADLMSIRKKGAIEASEAITLHREEDALNLILGRSGIMPIHQNCSVDNYVVSSEGQYAAIHFSKYFIENFDNNQGSCFVFSGETGTGKNHLSAAICNELMSKKKTCLIITVSELMMKFRKCYSDKAEHTEDEFMQIIINFDLLILDEIGLQKGSDHEKLILNQVIDQRIGNLKPVGILTNLESDDIEALLGKRIFDRLKSNNGQWISFDWNSYR